MKFKKDILLALQWYHPKIKEGVTKYALEHNWHINYRMVINPKPILWDGDGIIACLTVDNEYSRHIFSMQQPKICLGMNELKIETIPFINEDNIKIGQMAFDYFATKGFQNYGIYKLSGSECNIRANYFCNLVTNNKFQLLDLTVPENILNRNAVHRWLCRKLKKAQKPIAILAMDDYMGTEIIEAAIDSGLKIPEDIAVLGIFNDEDLCQNLPVQLSSIDNNYEQVGYRAAELLSKIMEGEKVPKETLVPPVQVVSRQSTDIYAVNYPKLLKALEFIKKNYHEPIGIPEIVSKTPYSEATLYRDFKKHLNSTPGKEILRLRLEETRRELLKSNHIIEDIAYTAGFENIRYFYLVFKKTFGCTPTEYKNKFGRK